MTRTVIGVGVAVLAAGGLIVWGVLADRPEELSASEPAEQAVATLESADAVLEGVQTLIRTGESDRALAVLDAAVRTYPDDRELRLAFAELLVGRGEPGEAYAQYEVAITAGEPEAAVEFKAGGAAGLMGDREKAAAHYAKAAELEPGNADYAETLGLSLIGINDLEAAKVSLLRATAVDPDRGRSWGALAEIALRQNSTGLARQHARRAQQSQPGVAAWRVIEARALKREGSVEDALLLLLAIEGTSRTPAILRATAECYGLLELPGEAEAMYVEAAGNAATAVAGELWREAALWAERAGDLDSALRHARSAAAFGDEAGAKIAARLGGG